jgi:hypothetical protein
MGEHNYERLHLAGTPREIREMVHNKRPPIFISWGQTISGLVSAFMAIAVGMMILPEISNSLRESGMS